MKRLFNQILEIKNTVYIYANKVDVNNRLENGYYDITITLNNADTKFYKGEHINNICIITTNMKKEIKLLNSKINNILMKVHGNIVSENDINYEYYYSKAYSNVPELEINIISEEIEIKI